MKKVILIFIGLWWVVPVYAACQSIQDGKLTVFAGVEYPTIESNSPPPHKDLKEFNVTPHLQVSYGVPVSGVINANLFMGYSKLGGVGYYDNKEFKREMDIHTMTLGFKGLVDVSLVQFGPVISINRTMKSSQQISVQEGNNWRTVVNEYDFNRFLATYFAEMGIAVQGKLTSHIRIQAESMFGLEDIFTHEEKSPVYPPPSIQMISNHYRVSIGYSF